MKISLAADHNGFDLKKEISDQLENEGHEVIDVGPHSHDPLDDYPDMPRNSLIVSPVANPLGES